MAGTPFCDVVTPFWSPNNFTQGHFLKIKWLVTDVTAIGSPDKEERATLRVILTRCFLANSGHICGQGATL